MEIMYLVLCVLCVGILVVTTIKNSKLIKETDSAKKEYLNARSNNIKLESNISTARGLLDETRELNVKLVSDMALLQKMYNQCNSEIGNLKFTVQRQSNTIQEQSNTIQKQSLILQEQSNTIREQSHILQEQSNIIQQQSNTIMELETRVSDLEYDNERLKQKLKIHDEVAKRSKVIKPFKATI